jgi:hypothetical protein
MTKEDRLYAETLGALDMLELVLYCDAMDAERAVAPSPLRPNFQEEEE